MAQDDQGVPPGSTDLQKSQPAAVAAPLALPPELVEATAEVLRRSRSETTWAIYRKAWRRFEGWCHARGYKPLEAAPELVAAYLVDAAKKGASVSDIEQRRAAISAAYAAKNLSPPTWHPLVKMALKGIRRLSRRVVHKKAAATEDILLKLVAALDRTTALGQRDATLLIIGQLGAMRRSALARIQVNDLKRDERGYSLRVPWDKTDQEGAEDRRKVFPARPGSPICPVAALDAWLALLGHPTDGPLFRQIRKGKPAKAGIHGRTVAECVKRAALAAHVPGDFSGHSLRAGMVTTALRASIPLDRIQAQTFHRDINVLLGYRREVDPFSDNAANDLARLSVGDQDAPLGEAPDRGK